MPDITAVPEGLSVTYRREDFPDRRIAIDVSFRVATFAGITSDDDATSADRQLERAIHKTQAAVRAVVAKWDAAEPAKHELDLERGKTFMRFTCSCGWKDTAANFTMAAAELAAQEHLLENGIVR